MAGYGKATQQQRQVRQGQDGRIRRTTGRNLRPACATAGAGQGCRQGPTAPARPGSSICLIEPSSDVPYVRYAFGLVGIAAAAALVVIIFKFVGSQFSGEASMLGMFILSGFMVVFMFVLFLFANFEDRNRQFLQLPAKLVAWLSVAIVIGLVVVAASIGVAQFPPHLAELVFAKPASSGQKLLRDKFKSREDYAQYCNDFDKESDHSYVEICINSSMKDFFQECSGFTPPAPPDEEQEVDDFACLDRTNRGDSSDAAPGPRICARPPCCFRRISPHRGLTGIRSPRKGSAPGPAGTQSSAGCWPTGRAQAEHW